MPDSTKPNSSAFSPMTVSFALIVSAYALVALGIGWGLQVDLLIRYAPTQSAMVPATAAAFLSVGLAILAAANGYRKLSHMFCAGVLLLVCIAAFGQIVGWQWATGLVFDQIQSAERMAHVTEFGFVLAVIAINRFLAGSHFLVDAIAIFGLSGALCLVLLNLTGMIPELGSGFLSGISLQTSALFGLLFLGLCIAFFEEMND